jgi:sugar-phosphatase
MRTLQCSAVLFDLDGVLIDSTRCVERHWHQWAASHGLDATDLLHDAHGVRNIDTMRRIAPHLDVEKEAALFAAHEVADTRGVAAVPGARSLLLSLQGARWAVVTSCSAELAEARLRAAGLAAPPLLITGTDVTNGKPDPEPYLMAASQIKVEPGQCIVVEDAPAGIQAGKRAGMGVLAIAFTYPPEKLRPSSPDFLVARLADVSMRTTDDQTIQISLPYD